MRPRFMSETFAKVMIYLITTAMLAAFVFFLLGARDFGGAAAAGQDDALPAQQAPAASEAGQAPAPQAAANTASAQGQGTPSKPLAGGTGKAAGSDAGGAAPASGAPDGVPGAAQAAPESESAPPPLPDFDILAAEWERLRAMGVEPPEAVAPEFLGDYHCTAYCCEAYPHICGGNGVTASGTVPTQGLTVASDWRVLPPGSWIYIEDVGVRRVEDSGSAILGSRLDIAVDTHENALRWPGYGNHNVWVLCWAG